MRHRFNGHVPPISKIRVSDVANASTALPKTAQRERCQDCEERQYVDIDNIPVKSRKKKKVLLNPMCPMTSYVRMCCEEQEKRASHISKLPPLSQTAKERGEGVFQI